MQNGSPEDAEVAWADVVNERLGSRVAGGSAGSWSLSDSWPITESIFQASLLAVLINAGTIFYNFASPYLMRTGLD